MKKKIRKNKNMSKEICAVDLFCGAGGLTRGLINSGINVVAGIDSDPTCEYPYEHNNGAEFLQRDIFDIEAADVSKLFGKSEIRLLAGCAPCQPFSTYSRKGRVERNNADWSLVDRFGKLVAEIQPELVAMENVPSLARHEVFTDFLKHLDGYHVWWKVVECSEIGVPQTRKRLVLLASRFGEADLSIESGDTPVSTVRSTIGRLSKLSAGDADPNDILHIASRLSKVNLERIRASKPGGTWRDWDPDLRAACHIKSTGSTYPSVYGRMEWDSPAPTITTQSFGYGNGRFGHPEQDRAITLREAAMLQTFPKEYAFVASVGEVRFSQLGRLIGNAVPVRLGEAIGEAFARHLVSAG